MNFTFQEHIDQIRSSVKRLQKIEGKDWGVEGSLIELMKQVGQLSALVMVQEKYYFPNRGELDKQYAVSKEALADELADIMFAVVRIADHYNIDLEEANLKAREIEDKFLKEQGL